MESGAGSAVVTTGGCIVVVGNTYPVAGLRGHRVSITDRTGTTSGFDDGPRTDYVYRQLIDA